MEMVILKDGRRGLFSKELMTIKTLELWEGDLPSITYHLTEQDLEDQVIRTVGGLVNWVYSNK
nr:MAG TPA: hypothetical protein [Caudoviricetes sp.]